MHQARVLVLRNHMAAVGVRPEDRDRKWDDNVVIVTGLVIKTGPAATCSF